MTDDAAPLACSLTAAAAAGQLGAWRRLARVCLGTESQGPGQFRAFFGTRAAAEVSAVADVERECCPFLSIELTADGDRLVLRVSTDQDDARPIVDLLLEEVQGPASS